jgi:hypothetical protein
VEQAVMPKPKLQFHPYPGRGESGVTRYAIGPDFIIIEFKSGDTYRYDSTIPGRAAVATMKKLAVAGHGLATFISREVGANYAEKL